jgi:hypothetical protein
MIVFTINLKLSIFGFLLLATVYYRVPGLKLQRIVWSRAGNTIDRSTENHSMPQPIARFNSLNPAPCDLAMSIEMH